MLMTLTKKKNKGKECNKNMDQDVGGEMGYFIDRTNYQIEQNVICTFRCWRC